MYGADRSSKVSNEPVNEQEGQNSRDTRVRSRVAVRRSVLQLSFDASHSGDPLEHQGIEAGFRFPSLVSRLHPDLIRRHPKRTSAAKASPMQKCRRLRGGDRGIFCASALRVSHVALRAPDAGGDA